MSHLTRFAAGCIVALLASTPVAARDFSPTDLVQAEEFGQVGFDPTGRWLVFEVLRGQAVSGPFDYDTYTPARRGSLWVADIARGGPPRPLAPSPAGVGITAGPFSPDGKRLAILRLKGRDWQLGVVALAKRDVTWLDVTPELGELGQTLVWRSPTELVVAARPRGDPPFKLRYGWQARERLSKLWAQGARGQRPALTVIGSGRFRDVRPKAALGSLLLVDVASGRRRRLAEGEFYDLELSPDGRRVAAMRSLEDVQAGPEQRLRVASPARRRNLLLVDLADGHKVTPCADCDLATHLISWSPRSDQVLVYGRRGAEPWDRARLLVLGGTAPAEAGATGLSLSLAYTSEGYEIPPATWLGDRPAVFAQPSAGGRADWYRLDPAGPWNLTGDLAAPDRRLVAHEGGSLIVQAGGAAWRVSGARPAFMFPMTALAARSGLGLSNRLKVNVAPQVGWSLGADGRSYRATDGSSWSVAPQTTLERVGEAVSRSGLAQVRRRADQTLTLNVRSVRGDRRLMTLNRQFAAVRFAKPIAIRGVSPRGEALTHWLYLPRPGLARARPPLVVTLYPGVRYDQPPTPYGAGIGRFPANPQVLAAAGFAVLVPSLPRDADSTEPAEGLADQLLAAVDAAAATGRIDATRVALYGHSFGGYAALMAASQSSRFKAVVAGAAPSDLTSMRGQIHPHFATVPEDGLNLNAVFGWSELGQGHLGVSPWEDPEKFRRNSPLFQVDTIRCPVLLIHGDGDFVRVEQAQELFSALYRQNKDAELVTVHGQGHLITSPADLTATYRLAVAWLREVLAPANP